jgi:hypothetical protein
LAAPHKSAESDPLNDFRFSFQLYSAIGRANSLGVVSARNSNGWGGGTECAGGSTGDVLCCHLHHSAPQLVEFRPRLVMSVCLQNVALKTVLEEFYYGSYIDLRGRIFTFCSTIITFTSTIITLSSIIITLCTIIITLKSTIITEQYNKCLK